MSFALRLRSGQDFLRDFSHFVCALAGWAGRVQLQVSVQVLNLFLIIPSPGAGVRQHELGIGLVRVAQKGFASASFRLIGTI